MALENIVDSAAGRGVEAAAARALGRRWAVTTAFGLVHGFGFSFALSERLQFAGSHLLTSLVAFNVGVEIAQLAVIVAAAAAVTLAFRRLSSPRVAAIVVSAIAAHTGWDWLLERGAVLWQFPGRHRRLPAIEAHGRLAGARGARRRRAPGASAAWSIVARPRVVSQRHGIPTR